MHGYTDAQTHARRDMSLAARVCGGDDDIYQSEGQSSQYKTLKSYLEKSFVGSIGPCFAGLCYFTWRVSVTNDARSAVKFLTAVWTLRGDRTLISADASGETRIVSLGTTRCVDACLDMPFFSSYQTFPGPCLRSFRFLHATHTVHATRLVWFTFVCIFRITIAVFLMWWGTAFLVETVSMSDLLLNTVCVLACVHA